jgi:hypothetical protein
VTPRPHHLLWSYHYARSVNLRKALSTFHHKPVVFCDSGAYSAMTIGAPLDLGEYAEWLTENRDLFEVYANLDVIGDPDKTWANQVELEKRGLEPLPVFHFGGDIAHLNRYIDAGHTYIALGGTTRTPRKVRMKWFIHCFRAAEAARDRGHDVVFHGFGVTSSDLLAAFPWYSVDSTSWNQGFKFGVLDLFDQRNGTWQTVKMFDAPSVMAAAPIIRALNLSIDPFLNRDLYHHSLAVACAARSWRTFEDWCRRRWGPIELPKRDARDGLGVYLADSNEGNHRTANHALGDPGLKLYYADNTATNHRPANRAIGEPGLNLYLAAASASVHVEANAGLTDPGMKLYLAAGAENVHKIVNKALSDGAPDQA